MALELYVSFGRAAAALHCNLPLHLTVQACMHGAIQTVMQSGMPAVPSV